MTPFTQVYAAICSHTNTNYVLGSKVGESCYDIVYNYQEICAQCGEKVKGGTVSVAKNPPDHTYTWMSFGCNKVYHTYVRKCTQCGYVTESFDVACNGNCKFPFMLRQFM